MAGAQPVRVRESVLELAASGVDVQSPPPGEAPLSANPIPLNTQRPVARSVSRRDGRPGHREFTVSHGGLDHRLSCIQKAALFSGLCRDECAEVASVCRYQHLMRRETIFCEGDAVRCVSLLSSGYMKVSQLSQNGAEVILKLASPGEIVGGIGPSTTGLHSTTAQALESCELILWESQVFTRLSERFPNIQRNAIRILGDYINGLEERFRVLATEEVPARVAHMLVRLAERFGIPQDGAVRIGLSREELAQMTGTTLFSVSRLLANWERLGIIAARREAVLIYDRGGLLDLAAAA